MSSIFGGGGGGYPGLANALGAQAVTPNVYTQPPAFSVKILLEDGSVRAVVVDQRWDVRSEPYPLLTIEQAEAMVTLMNEEWHEKERERRQKEQQQWKLMEEQLLSRQQLKLMKEQPRSRQHMPEKSSIVKQDLAEIERKWYHVFERKWYDMSRKPRGSK